jgi:hypothetical protein
LAGGSILFGRGALALVAVMLCACGSTKSNAPVGSSTVQVVYFVEGTTKIADLTLETATGTKQENDVDVPVKTKSGLVGLHVTMPSGGFVYISAQNKQETGTISCRIEADGIEIASNESSGAYAIAQCDGRA